MNSSQLYLAIALIFSTTFLPAQDTVHVRIGDVFARAGPELIDVPVYVSLADSLYGFQFNILYDTSSVTLNDVLPGGELDDYGNLLYNETEPGRLRVLFSFVTNSPYLVTGEHQLVTLRFLVEDKAVGVFPISFGSDIPIVVDNGSTRPTVTSQNGNIVLGSDKLQLAVPDSLAFGITAPVCIPLIGNYIPSLNHGRLILTWDSTNIQAIEVHLNENPLRLTDEMIDISPGQLTITKPLLDGDTIQAQPVFTEIMEICFLPRSIPAGSLISLNRDSSYFYGPWADTLFNYDILFFSGALSFQELWNAETVQLSIGGSSNATVEEGLCLPVIAGAYSGISDATLDLTWEVPGPVATPVELDTVKGIHPHIDPISFRYGHPIPREEIIRTQWFALSDETATIARGDTLFEVCFTSPASCGTVKLSPGELRPATAFNRYDELTNRRFTIPHQITAGQILFGIDSVHLELENARFGGGPNEFPVVITSQRATAFSQGHLRIRYAADSLEFVSARILDGPENALINTRFIQQGEIDITLSALNQRWVNWEAGQWVELSFRPLVRPISTNIVFLEDPIYGGTLFLLSKDNFPTFLPASLVNGSLTVDSPTAVARQEAAGNNLKIYPNPVSSSGQLSLSYPKAVGKDANVEIFNSTGRLIVNSRLRFDLAGNRQLQLPQLPSGYYLIRIATDQDQTIQNVFIQ